MLSVALTVFLSISALGQSNRLQDLVGSKGASLESGMEQRGYTLTHTSDDNDYTYDYWWNGSARRCVVAMSSNNKVESITDATPSDCNQRASSGNNTRGDAAATAIGAAALIGVIALAHKAHNHDNDKHYDDVNQEAEYERGYRDGLYNSSYHNYSNADSYKRGYESGVDQRRNETDYASGSGGYRAYVNVNDLKGANGAGAEAGLKQRGFREVDSSSSGNVDYDVWWNSRTRQCIQLTYYDNRVDKVEDIGSHPKCR